MPLYISATVGIAVLGLLGGTFHVLWRHAVTVPERRAAITAGVTLAVWTVLLTVLAGLDVFRPTPDQLVPPVGVALGVALLTWSLAAARSASLTAIFGRAQASLIRLHQWRLVGLEFLVLMYLGLLPAVFALPAAIGDVAIALTAAGVARAMLRSSRPALTWHLLGILDLVVAVGLGIATSPGPTQLLHTVPTAVALTSYPLVLIPTVLVPLALALHFVSLRLLLGKHRPSASDMIGVPAR